jgi:hypothetical protein
MAFSELGASSTHGERACVHRNPHARVCVAGAMIELLLRHLIEAVSVDVPLVGKLLVALKAKTVAPTAFVTGYVCAVAANAVLLTHTSQIQRCARRVARHRRRLPDGGQVTGERAQGGDRRQTGAGVGGERERRHQRQRVAAQDVRRRAAMNEHTVSVWVVTLRFTAFSSGLLRRRVRWRF